MMTFGFQYIPWHLYMHELGTLMVFHDIILHRFDIWKHDVCGLWTVLRDFSEATCAETICRSARDLWRGVLVRPLQWLVPYIRVHVLQLGDM